MRLDARTIRDALIPARVLDHFEIIYREARDELHTRSCPACGERGRESVGVHASSGLWKCQRCSARGDVLALIAGYARLDIKKDFRRIIALGAMIAGIAGGKLTEADRALITERRKQAAERLDRQRERDAAARARMPHLWNSLAERDVRGETYLRERGLDPVPLRAYVRYTREGDPALPLRDLATGHVVGVQHRLRNPEREPTKSKLLCFGGSQLAGSALHGRLDDLDPDGIDVAVVVEGLADTLAGILAFEGCVIFGAPGAAQVPGVVAAVAARVAACRGYLLLVVDNDKVGVRGGVEAVLAAESAGLRLAPDGASPRSGDLQLVRLGRNLAGQRHHDLADAVSRSRWHWERTT